MTGARARTVAAALLVAAAVAAPRAAEACYVCMSGRDDDSGRAFFLGSVVLSLLPFALFGGIGVFFWRRLRAAERTDAARTAAAHTEPTGVAPSTPAR